MAIQAVQAAHRNVRLDTVGFYCYGKHCVLNHAVTCQGELVILNNHLVAHLAAPAATAQ